MTQTKPCVPPKIVILTFSVSRCELEFTGENALYIMVFQNAFLLCTPSFYLNYCVCALGGTTLKKKKLLLLLFSKCNLFYVFIYL